ncbi:Holliday junction ATP-dependent DNA helicase RuvA [Thermobacillus xylanilyticus]|jgi:Holliday junction DNA helicase RuvA|uniref:Holliday junction branch migration complex subunit RuvA n=1 Tax=Thermobacillus xylanilyticus TaxID=76633 RepID=A0ABM8V8M1_THEXY|nr:Holliday junction branch migration protein RuvA [Thermobacillus xylanilyticus]CAG5092465.1 Holliday junction ATP-dependent DNA helicase RuvA [Thermobacillus xylanilyticus]
MIDYIRGPVAHIEEEWIVVDVAGVGYRVFTPNPYAFAASGEPVTVYTHHHVREDAMLLFGFATREEQRLFRALLEVSGVGPKVALGVLAGARPEAIAAAIRQENVAFLTKLPGIGRKTAQRMILDLKDKLDRGTGFGPASGLDDLPAEPAAAGGQGAGTAWPEAREALAALGYTAAEIDRVWQTISGSVSGEETADALVKRALTLLFRG